MTVLPVLDSRQRPLHDLRISVTDRCNFRCSYCMPKEIYGPGFKFLAREKILSFEEITRVAEAAVSLGVNKLRITGGEPLLRTELHKLIALLRPLRVEMALTTNGVLLAAQAQALRSAGLDRVTVSLDSLDNAVFQRMSETRHDVADVLGGIDTALAVGLGVKVNCVVRRGVNDAGIGALAAYFGSRGISLRFIEFMDVGITNGWKLNEVVSGQSIIDQLGEQAPLEPVTPAHGGEVARRFRYPGTQTEVGVITSVTAPFCGTCSRARLSADGHLYTCLFAHSGLDLRPILRQPSNADTLHETLRRAWQNRSDNYSERRTLGTQGLRKVEMSYIGG